MSKKSKVVSEKDFNKLKSGQTVFTTMIDQIGNEYLFEILVQGKKVDAQKDSITQLSNKEKVKVFVTKNIITRMSLPDSYQKHNPLFWTRRAALAFIRNTKHLTRKIDRINYLYRT